MNAKLNIPRTSPRDARRAVPNGRCRTGFAMLAAFVLASWAAGVGAAPGDLDPSYGRAGVTRFYSHLGIPTDTFQISDLALQPDGKLVVIDGGGALRLNRDGSLDKTFGSQGFVSGSEWKSSLGAYGTAYDVAVQSDGKIVVVGYMSMSGSDDFFLVRMNVNGTLDTSFGTAGTAVTDFYGQSDFAGRVALQSDGKIVVAGSTLKTSSASSRDWALARYLRDGRPDLSFGTGGKVTTEFLGQEDRVSGVVVQADGRIVVAGTVQKSSDSRSSDFALCRYLQDGMLDSSFGGTGKVLATFGGEDVAYSLALQSDGKLVVAGSAWTGLDPRGFPLYRAAMARFQPDGSLDGSFGRKGKVRDVLFGDRELNSKIRDIALQADGKIVAAGYTYHSNFGAPSEVFPGFVVRYQANGALDFERDLGVRHGDLTEIALQSNGKILVGGNYFTETEFDAHVTRIFGR